MKRFVCCCVSESAVRREVHQAGEACGVTVVDVDLPLERRPRRRLLAGLVYDLAPWNDGAVVALQQVRADFPTMPVFLVVPARDQGPALLSRCVTLPCVHGVVHASGAAPQVRAGMEEMMAKTPAMVVGRIITALFPDLPECIADYARCVVDGVEIARDAVRVGDTLPLVALTPRVAERMFRDAGLPAPKRLADWLTLMLIALNAERGQITLVDAARHCGYNSNDFGRLRHRLLPRGLMGLDTDARQAFDLTLLAFAEACGMSRERALSALKLA